MTKQPNAYGSGATKHPLYGTWTDMLRRCNSPKNKLYSYYGGRGITVCDRWHTFELFISDVGQKPSKLHTLDRVNNDLGYSPENVKWATKMEQACNRRVRVASKTGFTGVTAKGHVFQAYVTINKQKHYLGVFKTAEEAVFFREQFKKLFESDPAKAMLTKPNGTRKSKLGVVGVYQTSCGYSCHVDKNKTRHYIGHFKTIEEASNARQDFLRKAA